MDANNIFAAFASQQSALFNTALHGNTNTGAMPPVMDSPLLQNQMVLEELYRKLALEQMQLLYMQQQQKTLQQISPAATPLSTVASPTFQPTGYQSLFSALPPVLYAPLPSTSGLNALTQLQLHSTQMGGQEKSLQQTPAESPVDYCRGLLPAVIKEEKEEVTVVPTEERIISFMLPTPETTPSPNDLCRPSPAVSTSSARQSQTDDDGDEELYIDVEDCEEKVCGKAKRKAHIEFYRKLKAIRQREKKLQCAMCVEVINNNDHTITEHVQTHAGGTCYKCMICGWNASQKTAIYEHMKENHPKKPSAFSDRRDMNKLSNIITDCFPRNGSRTKMGYVTYVDKLVKTLQEKGIDKIKCKLCDRSMGTDKSTIMKHTHSHPAYRCKVCKFTSDTLDQQIDHCRLMHQVEEAKPTVHYNLCSAADAMCRSFQKCFSEYIE